MKSNNNAKLKCKCHPHSAFHWWRDDYPQKIDWSGQQLVAKLSENSSRTVNDKRALGLDVATIHGLGRTTVHLDPRRFHVYSAAVPSKPESV